MFDIIFMQKYYILLIEHQNDFEISISVSNFYECLCICGNMLFFYLRILLIDTSFALTRRLFV